MNNGVEANCISTDQRGASRDGVCDSGAYEYEGTAIVTTTLLTSTTTNPAVYGTAVALRASVFPAPSAGTVTFSEGVTTFGSATLDAAGIANFSMAQGDLDVGAHTIKATFIPTPDDAVSAGSSGTLVRDVTARPVAVTPDSGQSKQFGDSDPVLTYKVTTGSLVTGDSFTGALTRVSGEVLGPYAILPGSLSLGDNYNLNVASGVTFQVAPRAVEVTADAKTRDYGNADPALTYQVTKGTVLTGDSFTGELTRAVGENVGAYAITQGSLSLGANYAITYVGANLTITARAVTVTANPQTKIYGRDDPVFTYQVTQGTVREGDLFTGALARAAGKIVGTYAINQGTLSLGANYTITFVGADLIITPRPVDVTADAKTLQYGDAEQALTYTMTFGVLIPGDNFTGAIVREPGTDAGTYHITQGTLSLGSNYNMTFIGANYTINRRLVTVTVDAKTKVYGDVDPALTYKITSGSLAPGESFTGMIARDPGEDVGEYAITQFSLALTGNYNLTFSGANLTITPAQLTFTADSMMKHYLEDNPPLTYKVTGLKAGDTESDLGGLPSVTTTATKDSPGGTYDIVIGMGTMHNGNYQFHFVNGKLTIFEYLINLSIIFRQ